MLILAPMQGLTELLFRRAYSRCFPGVFDYAVSPFLSLTHGNLKDALKKVEDVLPECNEGSMPVVPQVLGKEADEFVDLANRLYDLGYGEVNWNMGCPMRRVAAKHRGSGILPFPGEVREILDYVMPRIKTRLSVKVRLGYRSDDEIDRVVPVLNDYPLSSVTVHPRIGKQGYSGTPDIERFAALLPTIRHQVVYNGDIFTVGDYERIRRRFPQVEDVMIGRGALYNPLLPMQIRERFPSDFAGNDSVVASAQSMILNDETSARLKAGAGGASAQSMILNDETSARLKAEAVVASAQSMIMNDETSARLKVGAVGASAQSMIMNDETSVQSKAVGFILSLFDDILAMNVSNEAKVRKTKEYWCLLSKALPQSEAEKRKVLYADSLDDIQRLVLTMTK